jgi:hypothetical protein
VKRVSQVRLLIAIWVDDDRMATVVLEGQPHSYDARRHGNTEQPSAECCSMVASMSAEDDH